MPEFDLADVIVFILLCPCISAFKLHSTTKSQVQKVKKNKTIKARTPVSLKEKERRVRLPRFLTTSRWTKQDPIEQQSKLLTLPAELRSRIWTYVYGETIHVARNERSLRCVVCPGPDLLQTSEEHYVERRANGETFISPAKDVIQCTCYRTGVEPRMHKRRPQDEIREERECRIKHEGPLSGLYRACKQTYRETIDVLYTKSTFTLPTQLSLRHFADNVPAIRLSQVRRLHLYVHLDSWTSRSRCGWHGLSTDTDAKSELSEACNILKTMSGLRELVVVLRWGGGGLAHRGHGDLFDDHRRDIWDPVKKVREALDDRDIDGTICLVVETRENKLYMEWEEISNRSEKIHSVMGSTWTIGRWVPAGKLDESTDPYELYA